MAIDAAAQPPSSTVSESTEAEVSKFESDEGSEKQKSFMRRHRSKFLCCLRYGGACCGGMVFGVGVLLICLFAFHVIGCSTSDPPCSYTMGDLTQPTLSSSFTSVKVWMQPSSAAVSAGVTHFVVQSKRATSTNGGPSISSASSSAALRFLQDSPSLDSLPQCGEDIGWDFVGIAPYDASGGSVEITGLEPDSSWVFRYKFRVSDGRLSTPSIAVVGGTKELSPPSPPTLLAHSSSVGSVAVQWAPVVLPHNGGTAVTGYELQWAEGTVTCNCEEDQWKEGETLGGGGQEWKKGGLESNQTISIRARAVNKVGKSEFSLPYPFRSNLENASPPGSLPSFSVDEISWNQIALGWTPPSDNGAQILRYKIQISSPSSSSLRMLGEGEVREVDGKEVGFVWEGLVQSTEYEFSISAVNSEGESEKKTLQVSVLESSLSVRTSSLSADLFDPPLSPETEYTVEVLAFNSDGPSLPSSQKLKTYAVGGCTSRSDVRWCAGSDDPYYDNSRLTDELASCAKSTLGSGSASEKCIFSNLVGNVDNSPFQQMQPMSSGCLSCFGQSVECNKRKCTKACQLGQDIAGKDCLDCVNTHCKGDTYSCMGMGADQSPPDPVRNP